MTEYGFRKILNKLKQLFIQSIFLSSKFRLIKFKLILLEKYIYQKMCKKIVILISKVRIDVDFQEGN